ncbi:MAG TPA: PKD domain-containing protein [Chitinophagales bacterium]|nr:PKD domain-containing protein [Chitinophagales bacterium]
MRKFTRLILWFFFSALFFNSYGQITSCSIQTSNSSGCAPFVLLASASENSVSPIIQRRWYLTTCTGTPVFNTGSGNNQNFSYIINQAGCYCLRLWSQNQNGDTCSAQRCNITVAQTPVINFAFSPLEGCIPLTVQALCNSTAGTGVIDSLVIDWGCGAVHYPTCPSTPIVYTYSTCQVGEVSPSIIIKNSFGCYSDTVYPNLINLIPNPIANFTADTTVANCTTNPLNVHFTADSTDPHLTYTWYINGVLAQSSTSRFLAHSFAVSANCYNVKLVVQHPSGCSDSITKYGYICVRNQPLISYTQNDSVICLPGTLVLRNTSAGVSALTWQITGPQGFGPITDSIARFNITLPGTYTLTATATFSTGCIRSITQQVLTGLAKPTAAFTADDTVICSPPHIVHYSATPCTGCTYDWGFTIAQPPTSTAIAPVETYVFYGQGNTTLIVTATNGCKDTLKRNGYIKIKHLTAAISADHFKGCSPVCTTFRNTTDLTSFSAQIDSICWSFPGSSIPGDCQDTFIQRCFTAPGCYNVKMVVSTTNGCSDSLYLVDTICVGTPPICSLTADPDTLCFEEDSVKFTLTCDSFSFAKVDFGDGTGIHSFYTRTFYHFYQDTGQKCATVVTYSDSCVGDTLRVCVQINPPITRFIDSFSCTTKDTVYLINESAGATSYKWHLCNGDSSTAANIKLIAPYCDSCIVRLETYNNITGCQHHKDLKFATPCDSVSITPADTQICAGRSLTFRNTSPNSTATYFNFNCPTSNVFNFTLGGVTGHTFNTPGVYCVGMVNSSSAGCRDTIYTSVTVCKAIASFVYDTTCYPAAICFHDSSMLYCTSSTWRWSFGDGTYATTQNPCHAYSSPGLYNVKLVVTSGGCTDSITKIVATSNVVAVNFKLDTIICPGHTSCVNNSSVGLNLVYHWYFPGVTSITDSTAASPCFMYNTPGDYQVIFSVSSNHQCRVIDTVKIHVHQPIAGGYPSERHILCPYPPHIISFTDTSKWVDSTWYWDFGDGTHSTQPNPGHIYDYPGTYIVSLTVSDKMGCTDSTIIDTIVVSGPFGTFHSAPLPGICACYDTMHYTVSTHDALTLTLLYGCNQGYTQVNPISPVGTAANPTNVSFDIPYCLIDTCQPQVIFGDTAGCLVTLPTPYIYVDSPQVAFTYNNFGVCYSGPVCFHDSTHYHLWSYQSHTLRRLWDFGDGGTDTSQNPCHVYTQPGGYHVVLYIWSNLGCYDSTSQTVVVPDYPVAGFYAEDSLICANLPICFHDSSQIYPLTSPWFWIWDFGDTTGLDTTYTPSVCHTYRHGGFYRITMCVYDSLGCSGCDSSFLMRVIANPIANAGGDQTICYGQITQLTGSGGISFQWQPAGIFSDPNIANPTVQLYNDTTITLIAGDVYGCADTDTAVLQVARVIAGFSVSPTACQGDKVCVTDSSITVHGPVTMWTYNFGDQAILHSADTCHRYTAPGTFNIQQKVTDTYGCTDSITKSVLIYATPFAQFRLTDTVQCSNKPLCVIDLSTSTVPITNWAWNFGDNSTTSGQNPPCHSYTTPLQAVYNVSLVVTDQDNCTDTALIPVSMHIAPTADFEWSESCETDSMPFISTSTVGSSPLISCAWTFWLGAPNPFIDSNCYTHFRFPAGNYNVQLVTADIFGCADTIIKQVLSDSVSRLIVYPGDTVICLGTAVDYTVSGVFNHVVWAPNIWLSNPNASTVTINPLSSTGYMITAANGVCQAAFDSFLIRVIQPIPIEVKAQPNEIVLGLNSNITSQIPGQIDSIIWSPDETLDCRNCENTLATPTQTTTYTATIYYSQYGVQCTNSAQVTITVVNTCEGTRIFVPNTFTPNNDGVNDIFMLRGTEAAKIIYFRVFDRWGRLVFEAQNGLPNNPQWGWDGTDKEGRKLNPAVYVYTYQIQCVNGDFVTGQGNVTLVR